MALRPIGSLPPARPVSGATPQSPASVPVSPVAKPALLLPIGSGALPHKGPQIPAPAAGLAPSGDDALAAMLADALAGVDPVIAAQDWGPDAAVARVGQLLADADRRADLAAAASATLGKEIDPPFTGTSRPLADDLRAQRVRDIAADLVAALAEQAASAARAALPSASDDAGREIWQGVLDMLDGDGLTPVIYCARSGRLIQRLDPAPWLDHCGAIAALGETRRGDTALASLYGSVLAQLGGTVSPWLLHSGPDALALLRETCPLDYLLHGLAHIFPLPAAGPLAQSYGNAKRAHDLARLRAAGLALPPSVVQYACEVVALYLSHVRPALIPAQFQVSAHYGPGKRDWAGLLDSPATVGHFCGRIMQSILHLIAAKRVLPARALSRADLLALRTSYQGIAGYLAHKRLRLMIRHDMHKARQAADPARLTPSNLRAMSANAGPAGLALDFGLSDLLDLQTALAVSGHAVPVKLASVQERAAVDRRKAKLQSLVSPASDQAAPADDGDMSEVDLSLAYGLADLSLSDALPADFDMTFDSAEELIAAGLLSVDDVAAALHGGAFDFEEPDDDETDDNGDDMEIDDTPLTWAEQGKLQNLMLQEAMDNLAGAAPVKLVPLRRV